MGKKASNPGPPSSTIDGIVASQKEIAEAFTEWDRRYREDPDKFISQVESLLRGTLETYGESCAPYFIELLREQRV